MKKTKEQKNKIIKSFSVVGLNEEQLHYYSEDDKSKNLYIQNIDILVKKLFTTKNVITRGEEKWHRVLKDSDTWFRIQYTSKYNTPITDFKIIGCKFDENENCLLIDKKYFMKGFYPIRITRIKDNDETASDSGFESNNNDNNLKNIVSILDEYIPDYIPKDEKEKDNNNPIKIPKEFDAKEIMNLPVKNNAGVILVSRKFNCLPLKLIQIQHLKENNYQFKRSKHKSPFLNKFSPEVLDEFPPRDSVNNNVSMFCFPEGVTISDKEIQPTKFNFVLTDEVGERTFGSVLIFWEKMKRSMRNSIEPRYDEEIQKTKEEIEKEKIELEKEIKEKKLKGEKVDEIKEISNEKLKDYYVPKALCILSKFPFFSNCQLFLKELYKIFNSSSSLIPLERAICGFVDSLYKQSYDKLIRFSIQNKNIDFYFIPNYGNEWDINDKYLETLFNVLSTDIITTAWQGLLLEKKLFLICSSKETLNQVAHSFLTLLYPFKWIHTYIPILPEKLKAFTESPMPLIFGIPFQIDLNELPDDSLIININKNCFENYREEIPKLTGKLKTVLEKKLNKLKEKYQIDKPEDTDKWMDYLDEIDPKNIPEKANKIDPGEIRDVFYDVFIHMFKNYRKYFNWKKDNDKEKDKEKDKKKEQEEDEDEDEEDEAPIEFKREIFLKDHNSSDDGSFLSMFCDTALFSQFISSISITQQDGSTKFFFECIKKGRDKNKVFLPNIIPKDIYLAPKIKIDDLNGKNYFHSTFPKLDPNLYIIYEEPAKPYKSKFIFLKDEWCYDPSKLKKKDWPKYFLYLIYEIWYNFFSFSIHFYQKTQIEPLMDYAIFLLKDLIEKKKITPTRNLFSKMFKACGRNELNSYLKQVLFLANKVYKKSGSSLFQNAYLNGLYALTENIGSNNALILSLTNSIFNATAAKQNIVDDITSHNIDYYTYFDKFIFLTVKYCPYCTKNIQKIKFISMEELLAGFNKNFDKLDSICPNCLNVISSNIYYLNKNDTKLEIKTFQLITPFKLINEIDKINKINGEHTFYLQNKFENNKIIDIYINIIFYFKLFDLPLFVLYIENDNKKFEDYILKEIEENNFRKNTPQKKSSKKGVSPDKHSKRLDLSSENKTTSGIGGTTDSLSMISGKTGSNIGISYLENELWKEIYLKNQNNIKLTGDKIGTEDRSHLMLRIKDMKSVLSEITSYFVSSFKEKLEEHLIEIGFNSEIKEKESINLNFSSINNDNNNDVDNESPFKIETEEKKNKIHKNRPQSVDWKRYGAYSSDNYNKSNNNRPNSIIPNYESNAFDAITKENREGNLNSISNKRQSLKLPAGFNQIGQLKDPNDEKSKVFGQSIKKLFSFKKKGKPNNNNNNNNIRESK